MTDHKILFLSMPLSFFNSNSSETSKFAIAKSRTINQKDPGCRKTVIRSATFVAIVTATLLMFSGCASFNKTLCLEGDWYEIGLRDGESGVESKQFDEYVDTCAKYDVLPDFAKYSEGRTKGLEFFCTRSVGYSEGRQGRKYRNVCSGTPEEQFLEGHLLGFNIYSAEETIKDLTREIGEKYEEILMWQKLRDENEGEELSDALSDLLSTDTLIIDDQIDQITAPSLDIIDAKIELEKLQELRGKAIVEYHKAIKTAEIKGFQE